MAAGSLEEVGGQPGGDAIARFLRVVFNDDGTLKQGAAADQLGLVPVPVKAANYAAVAGDFVPVDTTAAPVTVTLPTAPVGGSVVCVKQVIQGGTNAVTVACGGSDVFNKTGGAATATLTLLGQAILVQYKASAGIWYVIADDLPLSQLDARYPAGSGTSTGTNTGDQTSVSGNAGTATKLATARNIDGQAFDGSAAITVIAPGTHAATSKATPVDADELPLVDSAALNVLKKLTWANLKAALKAYLDPFYLSAFTVVPAPTGVAATDNAALAAAIAACPAGGVVQMQSGTYALIDSGTTTSLAIAKALTLRGTGGADTNWVNWGTRLTVDHATADGIAISSHKVNLDNFCIQNIASAAPPTAGAGIKTTTGGGNSTSYGANVSVRGFYINVDHQAGAEWSMAPSFFSYDFVYAGLRIQNVDLFDGGDMAVSGEFVAGPNNPISTACIQWKSGGGFRGYSLKTNARGTYAVLTEGATPFADGDTCTLNGVTYRFKTTMAQANDVKLDGSGDVTLDNLVKAVNQTGVVGTDYFAGTVAPANVRTAYPRQGTGATATVTFLGKGAYASTTTGAHSTFAATTFSTTNPTAGLNIELQDGVSTSDFILTGSSVENSKWGLLLEHAGPSNTGVLHSVVIVGNEFAVLSDGTTDQIALNAAVAGKVDNVLIAGNIWRSFCRAGVSYRNIDNISLGPNVMQNITYTYLDQGGNTNVTGLGQGAANPPGYEVGYAQVTANKNITDTAEATATALISSGAVTFDGAPVMMEFFAPLVLTPQATSATDFVYFTLFEGATEIARLCKSALADLTSGQLLETPVIAKFRFTPTAGAHTYKICAFTNSVTGTPIMVAGSGGTGGDPPAYVRFTKV